MLILPKQFQRPSMPSQGPPCLQSPERLQKVVFATHGGLNSAPLYRRPVDADSLRWWDGYIWSSWQLIHLYRPETTTKTPHDRVEMTTDRVSWLWSARGPGNSPERSPAPYPNLMPGLARNAASGAALWRRRKGAERIDETRISSTYAANVGCSGLWPRVLSHPDPTGFGGRHRRAPEPRSLDHDGAASRARAASYRSIRSALPGASRSRWLFARFSFRSAIFTRRATSFSATRSM
jgi:hypothetical protein